MSIDETLIIFNNFIGEKDFSDNFITILSENNLNESDGYLIKFKVYNDILSQKVNENNIISYINNLITQLADKHSYNNYIFDYDYNIIQYLINNEDSKTICENCSEKILFIDKYCYHCGKKQNPQIKLFELLSSINSSDIKPGDIIKINEDYSIDKTSTTTIKSQENLSNNSEPVYNPLNKNETEHKYLKIIILDYINRNKNISSFIDVYPNYTREEIFLTVYELEQENLISKSIKDIVKDYYFSLKNNSRDKSSDVLYCEYNLSQKGIYVLESHPYVLFYYQVIKNSVVDDIVEFDRLCQNRQQNQTFKDMTLSLIYSLRKKFHEKNLYNEYYSSYDMEAYLYELFGEFNNRIFTLFKKLIIKSNHNIQLGLNPLEYDYLKYLVGNINNLNIDNIQYLLHQAFMDLNDDTLIIKENELYNCLTGFMNGKSIDSLNYYLNEIC